MQIPASELVLGWIELEQPMNKVEQIYGNLSKINDQGFFQISRYIYRQIDRQIVFLVDKKGVVQAIRVEDYDEQKFIEARRKK